MLGAEEQHRINEATLNNPRARQTEQSVGTAATLSKHPQSQAAEGGPCAVRSPIKLCMFPGGEDRLQGPAFQGMKWQLERREERSGLRLLVCRDSKPSASGPKLVHFGPVVYRETILRFPFLHYLVLLILLPPPLLHYDIIIFPFHFLILLFLPYAPQFSRSLSSSCYSNSFFVLSILRLRLL
jgi:hypothetical protein